MANVILSIAMQFKAKQLPYWVAVDSLESGLPPKSYRDMLLAIMATWELVAGIFGRSRKDWPKVDAIRSHPSLSSALRISKRWLRFADRSETQYTAISVAKVQLSNLPIMLFGPSSTHGRARSIEQIIRRWDVLYKGEYPTAKDCPVRLFCSDNIQEYDVQAGDYGKMNTVVNSISDFVASHEESVGFLVSQLGMGSEREEREGRGRAYGRGGKRLAEEVNVLFRTKYNQETTPHQVAIQTDAVRDANIPRLIQELDETSGAFLRPAEPAGSYE